MANGKLLSLGSVNLDFQVRIDRWPEPGETILGEAFLMAGGGKAANRAYLARHLGAEAALIARVGDDALAEHALETLREAEVDLRETQKVKAAATAISMIMVRSDGNKAIVLAPNANNEWREDEADKVAAAIDNAPDKSVLAADLEIPRFIVETALQVAKKRSFQVILDPSPPERMTDTLYQYADYLTPNQSECQLLGCERIESVNDALEAADTLHQRGVRTAMVKLAGGGCVIVSREHRQHISSFGAEAIDTTGAGDSFAGSLAVALLEGRSDLDAARFAAATASLAVVDYGSQQAYPSREELEQFIHEASQR